MVDFLMNLFEWIALVIKVLSMIVIVLGILWGFYVFMSLELRKIFKSSDVCYERENLRLRIGSYLLLGFEMLIAADLIATLIEPSMERIIQFGSIVAIRTVLSFFLSKELEAEYHELGKISK